MESPFFVESKNLNKKKRMNYRIKDTTTLVESYICRALVHGYRWTQYQIDATPFGADAAVIVRDMLEKEHPHRTFFIEMIEEPLPEPSDEYEYEFLFVSDPEDEIKIDGWLPLKTSSIGSPEKIQECIEKGLVRPIKTPLTNEVSDSSSSQ